MPKRQQETRVPDVVQDVLDSNGTKSDKIRELHRLRLPRADIARALDVRYQYVRNVLEHDQRRAAPDTRLSAAERRRVTELTANLDTKAARIRALDAAGFRKPRIADALGLRYQHVYNVLVAANTQAGRVAERRSAAALPAPPPAAGPTSLEPVRVVIENGCRVTVPRRFADAAGMSEGDEAVICLEGDELRLYSRDTAIRRVQQLVARHVPADVSLVDELIAERRREAARAADRA